MLICFIFQVFEDNYISGAEEDSMSASETEFSTAVQPITPVSSANKRRNSELTTEVQSTTHADFKKPKHHKQQPDRYDLIGNTIAVRLRGLEKRLSLITEKNINDILFNAEMSQLDSSSQINFNSPSASSRSNTPGSEHSPSSSFE